MTWYRRAGDLCANPDERHDGCLALRREGLVCEQEPPQPALRGADFAFRTGRVRGRPADRVGPPGVGLIRVAGRGGQLLAEPGILSGPQSPALVVDAGRITG